MSKQIGSREVDWPSLFMLNVRS